MTGYAEEGEWVPSDVNGNIFGDNDNCTDPQKLFEYVVAQPSDILYGMKYFYVRQSNQTKVYPSLQNGVITKIDIMDRGTNAKRMIMNQEVMLRLGFVGVKNRAQEDI